ncbi:MAG: M23 family metallopeptidase [Rectinema sp.]|nr:M23 family metallopeptidase [Rectinema sp.]
MIHKDNSFQLFAILYSVLLLLLSGCTLPTPPPASYAHMLPADALLEGIDPHTLVAGVLPSTDSIMAMLTATDIGDSIENREAEHTSLLSRLRYRRIASLQNSMKQNRKELERYMDSAWPTLRAWHRLFSPKTPRKVPMLTDPGLYSLPRPDQLEYAHTWALDIFLQNVRQLPGGVQKGPRIYSLSDGIVIAAASNWHGFPRIADSIDYLWGGLSPKAGNGVIVYAPTEKRYYLYFHFYRALVYPGQIVLKGTPLGFAGNSGINARKKGGGEHLHLEIFNASTGSFLRNTQLMEMLAKRKSQSIFPED